MEKSTDLVPSFIPTTIGARGRPHNWAKTATHRYQGEFIEGKREGHGCLTYSNGDTYDGEWANNYFHGHGIFTTHNFVMSTAPTSSRGQRYEGMYECGQKHGQGLFHVGDGGTYEGSFEDNL
mmetsp:Transcript_7237/g.22787  ORF Transcript_7237/g.22787 Transcript_7237/m.22787 type:complete len:122 (-) Transcript_7237:2443-2808(-)